MRTIESKPKTLFQLAEGATLSSGGSMSCGLLPSGQVKCWGANYEGQLGVGTTEKHGEPMRVEGLEDAALVSVGAFHACAQRLSSLGATKL